MTPSGLRYDRYRVNGHDEWLMRVGQENGVPVLLVPPLFEEMNRTRALLASVMRALARSGFRCTLPDLPGTGESERALETCGWADWQEAVRAADRPALVASFRGGALLDGVDAQAWWRFAPASGASLLRDLERSDSQLRLSRAKSRGAGTESSGAPLGLARDERRWFAGYGMAQSLTSDLREAEPPQFTPCRAVRLTSDPKPADQKLDGAALWRRSEPAGSPELANAIASDIAAWVRQCGIC